MDQMALVEDEKSDFRKALRLDMARVEAYFPGHY